MNGLSRLLRARVLQAAVALVVQTGLLLSATAPKDWVPLRWDGGPLELARRQQQENYSLNETQEKAIREWYSPASQALLENVPYNCLLLTWSLGKSSEFDAQQRQLVSGYTSQTRERGFTVLAVVEFGPEWQEAVEAAAKPFDGVVLEGSFREGAAEQALDMLRETNPKAVVIPMDSWDKVNRDPRFPILASHAGVWPGMLTADEAEGWTSRPTSNPWVLSNGWQIGALRAGTPDRPIWMGHRPKSNRPQPLEFKDYARAVADSGMARARWVVALGDEWRRRLLAGEAEAIEEWRRLGDHVRFFEEKNRQWGEFRTWPSVVVVHDPGNQSLFDSFDVLNMLAVRHVPHRVVLRSELSPDAIPEETKVMAFDYAPPDEAERQTLEGFAKGRGTLVTGPRWSQASQADSRFDGVVGSVRGYPTKEAADSDRLSRDIRDLVDEKHAAPKLYNVGSIISSYSFDPASGRRLLEMTEYGDYPTENITVRLPQKIEKATLHPMGEEPVELRIYEGEEGGSEIDIPEVRTYCAVVID